MVTISFSLSDVVNLNLKYSETILQNYKEISLKIKPQLQITARMTGSLILFGVNFQPAFNLF